MENNKYYSVEEVAEILKVKRATIYKYINRGTGPNQDKFLKSTKIGRRQLIKATDLEEFLASISN